MDTFTFHGGINDQDQQARLQDYLAASSRTLVITGAGVSTDSGIPAYRDHNRNWAHPAPMQYQAFRASDLARRRYWARSMLGWQRMGAACPGPAHLALKQLQDGGHLHHLVTQNVDGLHHKAGSSDAIELHGSVHRVLCMDCLQRSPRAPFQQQLETLNPGWLSRPVDAASSRPDGDQAVPDGSAALADFVLPSCPACQGAIKPDVVFFGENVPRPRVEAVFAVLLASQLLLVVGSSLSVWSGYRFVRRAKEQGIPVVAVNMGATRGDADFQLKLASPVGSTLQALAAALGNRATGR